MNPSATSSGVGYFRPLAERSLEEYRMFLNRMGQQPGHSSTKAKVLAVWMTDNSPNRGWRQEDVGGSRRPQRRALGWSGAAFPSCSGRNERYHATASRASHKTECRDLSAQN